jgi:integrase
MLYKFASVFHNEFNDYIAFRASSGKGCRDEEYTLADLDRFLIKIESISKTLTEEMITKWFQSMNVKPSTKKRKAAVIGDLARYLTSLGIEAFQPEAPRGSYDYVPYIFSEDEFNRIISVADNILIPSYISGIQAAAQMPFLIRILFGCGLRLGEALSLCWNHIDLNTGMLIILYAKNEKQRIVPMSDSLTDLCAIYRNSGLCGSEGTDYLFGNREGKPYCQVWFRALFSTILKKAGIEYTRSAKQERGPCLHCLRHLFVLRSFSKAESERRSLSDSVPYLSTYLGHNSIMETDKYLKFSYEMYPDAHEAINAYTCGVFPKLEVAK